MNSCQERSIQEPEVKQMKCMYYKGYGTGDAHRDISAIKRRTAEKITGVYGCTEGLNFCTRIRING